MKKYSISKEFGFYAKMIPPIRKSFLPIYQLFLNPTYKILNKFKNISFTEYRIKNNVQLLVIEPKNLQENAPCLIHYHGGAFVLPAYNSQYALAAQYAVGGKCKVVFVNYRLAPKYTYPSQIEDSFNAITWVNDNATKLGIDKQKIAVSGDSAGGYLASLIAFHAKKDLNIKLSFQMLIYPVIGTKQETESMKKFQDTPMWNGKLNKLMWKWYLDGKENLYPSLLDTDIPNDIPRAYVETTEFDCLHDEGLIYGKKMQEAGIDVSFYEDKNAMHGFEIKDCSITRKAIQNRIDFIRSVWK